jgi:hypothetical protein
MRYSRKLFSKSLKSKLPVNRITSAKKLFFSFFFFFFFFFFGCTALMGLDRFFSSLIYTQSGGLHGRDISPWQGRYVHREQHKHRINIHRHPCLEWD